MAADFTKDEIITTTTTTTPVNLTSAVDNATVIINTSTQQQLETSTQSPDLINLIVQIQETLNTLLSWFQKIFGQFQSFKLN